MMYFSNHLPCYRFQIFLPDRHFVATSSPRTGWTHFVLNYLGPNDGEGIMIFNDGVNVTSDTTKGGALLSAGDGRIVVGRTYTNRDEEYASVRMDKLLFFNQTLSTTDIIALNNLL